MGRWIALAGLLFVAAAIVCGPPLADPVSCRPDRHHNASDGIVPPDKEDPDAKTIAQWKTLVRANREKALSAWRRMYEGQNEDLSAFDHCFEPWFRLQFRFSELPSWGEEYQSFIPDNFPEIDEIIDRRKPVASSPIQNE